MRRLYLSLKICPLDEGSHKHKGEKWLDMPFEGLGLKYILVSNLVLLFTDRGALEDDSDVKDL